MQTGVYFFIMISYLTVISAFNVSKSRADLVRFLLAVKSQYQSYSIVIAMTDAYGINRNSTLALEISRELSDKNVFSSMITVDEFKYSFMYFEHKMVKPLHVIFLQSSSDFESLVKFTKTKSSNSYVALVIFRSDNQTLMNICENPVENYFNLVLNTRWLVLCRYTYKQQTVLVREWYSIFPKQTITLDYAHWNNVILVRLNNGTIYERRKSLQGIALRVTSAKNETSERHKKLNGYFGDLLVTIAERGNFSIARQELEDSYGVYNKLTKKWNGIIGKLANHETDIGLGEFSITEERQRVVDFSEPVIISQAKYYVKKPAENVFTWTVYYKAFGRRSGYILLTIVFGIPPLISYVMLHKRRMQNTRKIYNNYLKIIPDIYLEVLGIICKMPLISFPEDLSLRIVYISLFFLSLMVSSLYSAILTSYLTLLKPRLPFTSMEKFIKDGTYRIAVMKDTSFVDIFEHGNSSLMKKLRSFLLTNEELPQSVSTAVEMVCTGGKIVLFMDEYNVRSNLSSPSCELVAFDQGQLINMAFTFVKHSPYVGFFNYYFQRLRSYGVLQVLRKRYERGINDFVTTYEVMTLDGTLPIFLILIVGILLSFVIMVIEKIYFYVSLQRHEFAKSRTNYWKPLIRPES